jgi:hypothetical protein
MKPKLPSKTSIARIKKYYRKLCETHPDPKVQRLAQAMEIGIRWATEKTADWTMKEEPILLADCLADDLRLQNK